jgi:hypothetical protein
MGDHPVAGEHHHPSAATALGALLLLPSELLHEILVRLAVPELLRVRSVARPLSSLISSPDFRRLYHLSSASSGPGPAAAWLLLFKKLPPRDAAIRGFHGPSGRWFRIPVSAILAPAVPPGEDLYFLAASGSSFLFAANGRRELVVVDLTARAARRLPPSPLGPRGTSSWRRFGLKLVADPPGSNRFRYPSFSYGEGLCVAHARKRRKKKLASIPDLLSLLLSYRQYSSSLLPALIFMFRRLVISSAEATILTTHSKTRYESTNVASRSI